MASLQATIRAYGGVAARRELLGSGHRADWIIIFYNGGSIERVRNGWYSLPDIGVDVKRAWRVGGRLGCVSAAIHHGANLPYQFSLHVNVATRSAKLRDPDDRRKKLAVVRVPGLVIHWVDEPSMQELQPRERQAVDLETATEQMARCPAWQRER